VWDTTYPISAYNVSLAATNYVGWTETWRSPSGKDMEVDYRVFPEDLAKAQVDFARTTEMLDLYSELFGEYPFVDEKYGMAEFVFDGAMEHQTMSSYGQSLITGDGYFDTLVGHELAHQWFGNLVTVEDWDEVWLHEGFATYAEALWVEYDQGPEARQVFMRQHSAYQVGFWGPVSPPAPLFGDTVYQKGAWVLHMLRKVVGENDFYQILRDYAASPQLRYGTATIADFVAIAEAVTGSELSWFFDEWIYRVGRPDYEMSWRSEELGESYRVILTIRQVQDGELYRMPLEIFVDTAGGSETFTVWNDGAYQVSTMVVDSQPLDVRFDPGDWVLRWNQYPDVATGTPSLRLEPLQLLPNVPNPFNPSTRLRFRTPGAVPVQLRILDARGRTVRSQDLGVLSAGEHDWVWRGVDANGAQVASGVYTVILQGAGTQQARRITLVK
jgi:aminopeptidase N